MAVIPNSHHYGDLYPTITIRYHRPETPEEVAVREIGKREREVAKEAKERELFEQLRKKFE